MAETCLFCSIAAGEADALVVYSDDNVVAFLDTRPVFEGHVLVVTRRHVATLVELPADLIAPLFGVIQLAAAALESALGADGTFVGINNRVSQSVAHLHVHVIPRHRKDGLRGFFWPRRRYATDEQMDDIAKKIRTYMEPAH